MASIALRLWLLVFGLIAVAAGNVIRLVNGVPTSTPTVRVTLSANVTYIPDKDYCRDFNCNGNYPNYTSVLHLRLYGQRNCLRNEGPVPDW